MAWLVITIAGVLEAVWAIALKESDGFSKLVPTLIFLAAGGASIVLLALALRELPVGTGYAVWTGIGAVGAALAGVVVLGEAATAPRLAAIALIATGIVWLALQEGASA
ncbi:MAG TPA: SMR family transporter [Solirubrobacterales bacterium]|jgi:quaternary ammonium compound-resistance protein SugE